MCIHLVSLHIVSCQKLCLKEFVSASMHMTISHMWCHIFNSQVVYQDYIHIHWPLLSNLAKCTIDGQAQ